MRQFIKEENLVRGLRLALAATLATALFLAYDYLVTRRDYVEAHLGAGDATLRFALDVLGVFVALFISATAGFAWARGPRLVGFGTLRRLRRDLVLIVPLGAALAALTLVVLEPLLYRPFVSDERNPLLPLFTASFEEVICRWGIFAIAFRLSGRLWASVLTSAVFNVLVAFNTLSRVAEHLGIEVPVWQVAAILGVKFALATGFAVFFVRKGLLSTMALRFVAGLPAPFLAIF